MLVDAFDDEYDVAVVVSNDSDLAEPIRLVKARLGRQVLLLNPRPKTAADLVGIADENRSVHLGTIRDSQFPHILADDNGLIEKPSEWSIIHPLTST